MKSTPKPANSNAAARDRLTLFLQMILATMITVTQLEAVERPPRIIPNGDGPRDRFLKLIDRPRVPLNAAEQSAATDDGLLEVRFAFDSESTQRVPGVLLKPGSPAPGPLPAVIVLHGTGGSKEAVRPLLREFAAQGVIGVAIDARYAGERVKNAKGNEAYRAAILETWKTGQGFPFLYDTVWDLLRLIDYLENRPDIDREKIAAVGFSKGGTELYLAAAVDERIIASVPCIGVQSFDWALSNNAWQSRVATIQSAVEGAARDVQVDRIDAPFVRRFYQRVVPGIENEFDGPKMLPLIAPRPLLVINGERDDRTPAPGVNLCADAAREAYRRQGAEQNFELRLQPNVGHAVTPESERFALNWLVKHLK